MRRSCSFATLACLLWTFLLFPSVEPVLAQSSHGRSAPGELTWISPDGLLLSFHQIGNAYQVEFFDQETGESMRLDFLPQLAQAREHSPRFAIRVDDELELLYQGAGHLSDVGPQLKPAVSGADQMIVRFRGQEKVAALMPPMLDAAMGSEALSLSPAASLMASSLATLHGEAFYGKIESSMEALITELEATAGAASTLGTKTELPNWFHCLVGIAGWIVSWGCVVAGCATLVACAGCIALHTAVTVAMVDTCSQHRSEIIRE